MGFLKKFRIDVIIVISVIFLIILISIAGAFLSDYYSKLTEKYESVAMNYSQVSTNALGGAIDYYCNLSAGIAEKMPEKEDEAKEYILKYALLQNEDIADIRYFIGDKEFNYNGNPHGAESTELIEMKKAGELSYSRVVFDKEVDTSCFVVYAPALNDSEIDGILVFIRLNMFFKRLDAFKSDPNEAAVYQALCSADGLIVYEIHKKDFPLWRNANIFDELRGMLNDKSLSDKIEKAAKTEKNTAFSVRISGDSFIIAAGATKTSSGKWFIAEVFDADVFLKTEKGLIGTFGALILIMSLLLILLLLILITEKRRSKHILDEYDSVDPTLGSPTFKKFSIDAEDILSRNKITKFAIIYVKAIRFEYIHEHFGESVSDSALRFLVKVLEKVLIKDETFGRIVGEQFALMMHYQKLSDLMDRLKVMNAIIFNCPALKEYDYNMKVSAGIYPIDRENDFSLQKMLDRAIIAQKLNDALYDTNINVYDDKIQSKLRLESEIEAKMDAALKNGEFLCFYQPKYNASQDRVDSCEALVRWYDYETDTYRNPEVFLSVFEANGFISNLDKYIFSETCKFIDRTTAKGEKVVPVSVNVSRVTAIKSGFTDYYIHTKNKYKIADGFITIEFTESFASGNLEMLKEIVAKLQRNGFRCSIDDFGSGYSSYNVLKDLSMDELKLDKFFILPGLLKERDDTLLRSTIEMAKNMGMKVVQEGVETKDEFNRLVRFGCDVIQGYLYSRPLPADEYIKFINTGGRLNVL